MTYLPPLQAARIPTVLNPLEACCYCWYTIHPGVNYPETWSSTICTGHDAWLMDVVAVRRAQRAEAQARKRGAAA